MTFAEHVLKLRNYSLTTSEEASNYSMGLAGEAGEVIDIVKKHIYHKHELDREHLIEEMGDIYFYLVALGQVYNITEEDFQEHNKQKLSARYPSGFDVEKSKNRNV